MSVLNVQQLEVIPPIGPLFRQRRIAKTTFYPGCNSSVVDPCLLHIVQVLVAGNRAASQRLLLNGTKEGRLSSCLYLSFNQIAHGGKISFVLKMTNSE